MLNKEVGLSSKEVKRVIGTQISCLRKQARMSQESLSAALEISLQQATMVEQGIGDISAERLYFFILNIKPLHKRFFSRENF